MPFKEGKMCLASTLLAMLRELAAARAQFCTLHTLWRLVLVLSHGGLFPSSTVLLDTRSPSSFIPPLSALLPLKQGKPCSVFSVEVLFVLIKLCTWPVFGTC